LSAGVILSTAVMIALSWKLSAIVRPHELIQAMCLVFILLKPCQR